MLHAARRGHSVHVSLELLSRALYAAGCEVPEKPVAPEPRDLQIDSLPMNADGSRPHAHARGRKLAVLLLHYRFARRAPPRYEVVVVAHELGDVGGSAAAAEVCIRTFYFAAVEEPLQAAAAQPPH